MNATSSATPYPLPLEGLLLPDPLAPGYLGTYSPPAEYVVIPPFLSKQGRKAVKSLSKLTPEQRQRVIDRETVKRASPPPAPPFKQPSKEAFEIAVKMLAYRAIRQSKKD